MDDEMASGEELAEHDRVRAEQALWTEWDWNADALDDGSEQWT